MTPKKAYIWSYGAVSCFGVGVPVLIQNIFEGNNGLRPLTRFPTNGLYPALGGEVAGWELWIPEKKTSSWAFLWAKLAIQECLDRCSPSLPRSLPLIVSTTLGNMENLGDSCLSYGQLAQEIAKHFSFSGPVYTLNTACSSSLNALAFGWELLEHQPQFSQVLIVGVDALSSFVLAGFSSLKALTSGWVRPFSKNRDGLLVSEGAGAILMSLHPGNEALCLKGYGNASDANHLTGPHPQGEGLVRAIEAGLKMAHLSPNQIHYINAHGTGTPYNDRMETIAFHRVFGKEATQIPISSSKSMIGHALGAAGALESIICLEALKQQRVPPTIHYDPDLECDLDYVPEKTRPLFLQYCLKTASGFGGQNSALILEKE
ncbi:MAG: beta-ketoacyl-[acyl-carrier-protein] synthase family protein [Planctomycetota bacterium]